MSMTATANGQMTSMSDGSSALAWNHRALRKPVAVSLLLHATVFASLFAWWQSDGASAPRGLPDGMSVTFIELSGIEPSDPAPAAPQVPQEFQAAPVEPPIAPEPEPVIDHVPEPVVPVKPPVKPEVALEAKPEPRPEVRKPEPAKAVAQQPAQPQKTASLTPASLHTGTGQKAGQGASKGFEETEGQQTDEVIVLNPRYRMRPQPPHYPDRARSLDQQGVVKVRIKLDHRGDPMDVAILASSGYALLDHAALKAARKWRFEPEIRNGRPVVAFVEMPVEFVLTDAR
ncbi:TonB family protein [Parvibaculum sp.]|uniref:energy transducer TonB n=1 Tax=Parvibaculum sp. TaxID=2024848 RepID=UPI003BA97CAE